MSMFAQHGESSEMQKMLTVRCSARVSPRGAEGAANFALHTCEASLYVTGRPAGSQPPGLRRHGGSLEAAGAIPMVDKASRKASEKPGHLPAAVWNQNQEHHGELYTCQSGCKDANVISGRAFQSKLQYTSRRHGESSDEKIY